jgi:hypothetical protein
MEENASVAAAAALVVMKSLRFTGLALLSKDLASFISLKALFVEDINRLYWCRKDRSTSRHTEKRRRIRTNSVANDVRE